MFGAVNQLLAGLALIVITIYLKTKGGKKYLLTGIPCIFMLIMTIWSVLNNQINFIIKGNWLLITINGAILILSLWMVIETTIISYIKTQRNIRIISNSK